MPQCEGFVNHSVPLSHIQHGNTLAYTSAATLAGAGGAGFTSRKPLEKLGLFPVQEADIQGHVGKEVENQGTDMATLKFIYIHSYSPRT